MGIEVDFTKEDAIFFLDMTNSPISPNHKPVFFKRMPFFQLLSDKESRDYKRFINVYDAMREILSERDRVILDCSYGYQCEPLNLRQIGEKIGVTRERTRQLRYQAQRKVSYRINKSFKFKKRFPRKNI
ncbi:sigma factor-like helix-turn-helix DNA-binding protein [Lentibacillus juripiscarius]|uniref:Sigma factor-like helix-turn-helix DNA-binding protein n=1 Tax=Lentibacillus juripiscarius TaxID=257446 RepID=A0ABW5V6G7_9BACI